MSSGEDGSSYRRYYIFIYAMSAFTKTLLSERGGTNGRKHNRVKTPPFSLIVIMIGPGSTKLRRVKFWLAP